MAGGLCGPLARYGLFFVSIEKSIAGDPVSAYQNHQLILDAIKNKRGDEEVRDQVTRSLSHWLTVLNGSAATGEGREAHQGRGREPKTERSVLP